jgi:hypothetical protein
MQGMVKVPGVGNVKKQYVIAGAGIVLVVVAVAYMRRQSATTAAATTATDTTATGTSAGYAYDTGLSGTAAGNYAPYGVDINGNPIAAPTGAGTNGTFTTNQDWTSAAAVSLAEAGIATTASTDAIAEVLAGHAVTPAQKGIFEKAIGLLGQPPQGYPSPIKLTSTPTGGPGTVTPGKPAKLHATNIGQTFISLDWDPVKGATGYRVTKDGKTVVTVVYSTAIVQGLTKGHRYKLGVQAINGSKTGSASTITVATHTK